MNFSPSFLMMFLLLGVSGILEAENLEEVVMHEVTTAPSFSVLHKYNVGGNLGIVSLELERSDKTGHFSHLGFKFGMSGGVEISEVALSCIPWPVIEAPVFYFVELAPGKSPPKDWFSSILIPFGDRKKSEGSQKNKGGIEFNLYPAIIFEFSGVNRISSIKIQKDAVHQKSVGIVMDKCPKDLVGWAIGADK